MFLQSLLFFVATIPIIYYFNKKKKTKLSINVLILLKKQNKLISYDSYQLIIPQ